MEEDGMGGWMEAYEMSEPLDLDAIEARERAATPGPWRWQGEDYRGGWGWQLLVGSHGEGLIVGQEPDGGPSRHLRARMPVEPALCATGLAAADVPHVTAVHVQEADAAFIQKARTDVPAMAREIRRLREENARLKGFAEAVVENFDCDCEEMDMERDGVCFWCQAKEALPAAPEEM